MKPELPLSCHEFRITALEMVERTRPAPVSATALPPGHACGECERWIARLALREGLVRSLPRHLPPEQLDSALAEALGVSARQDRAVAALRSLGRVNPDAELDRAVEAQARAAAQQERLDDLALRQRAPGVLDRLVAEELADPAKAHVARQLENLERGRAPAELELRVRYELSRPASRSNLASRRVVALWAFAAAALLAVSVSPLVFQRAGDSPRAPRRFRVEVVESTRDLSPAARAWIETASGGMLSQHNI